MPARSTSLSVRWTLVLIFFLSKCFVIRTVRTFHTVWTILLNVLETSSDMSLTSDQTMDELWFPCRHIWQSKLSCWRTEMIYKRHLSWAQSDTKAPCTVCCVHVSWLSRWVQLITQSMKTKSDITSPYYWYVEIPFLKLDDTRLSSSSSSSSSQPNLCSGVKEQRCFCVKNAKVIKGLK